MILNSMCFKRKRGNMERIETFIIINIVMSCILLYSLYKRISAGRFIIKTKRKKIWILYFLVLILWTYMTGDCILDYLRNKNIDVFEILQGVTWIQLCIAYLLNGTSLGVTKGGVYSGNCNSSNFTRWNRIRNYTWISDNVVQFEFLGKENRIVNTDLEVDRNHKEEINEILRRHINKADKASDEKRNFTLIISIVLIGVVMSIGHANLIKISKPYMITQTKVSEEESMTILKKTWKPLKEIDKKSIKSMEDFNKVFEKTMSKSMIDDLYRILVDKDKSVDGQIKFKENTLITTVYNTRVSIKKSYMKSPKYKDEIKQGNIEELTIEEAFRPYEDDPSSRFKRKSTFIKNDNGDWILNRISGLTSIGS